MKKLWVLLLGMTLLTACGGSSGGGGSPNAPVLTLSYINDRVGVGGEAYCEFEYSDPDGNISRVFIRERFLSTDQTSEYSAGQFAISGTSGWTFFTVSYPTAASRGRHDYEVWVTDAAGNRSNTLTFSVTVV